MWPCIFTYMNGWFFDGRLVGKLPDRRNMFVFCCNLEKSFLKNWYNTVCSSGSIIYLFINIYILIWIGIYTYIHICVYIYLFRYRYRHYIHIHTYTCIYSISYHVFFSQTGHSFHVLVQVYPVADPFGNNGWGVPRKSRPAEKNFGESSSFRGRWFVAMKAPQWKKGPNGCLGYFFVRGAWNIQLPSYVGIMS